MKYLIIATVLLTLFYQTQSEEQKFVKGRIESCPGCKLNRLKDVKLFIYEDVPKYADITFKKIHGAPPELVMLDEDDNETERIKLESLTREECNALLLNKGFMLKLAKRSGERNEL